MRPTPEGVGNIVYALYWLLRWVAASMRPTPEGVGNFALAVMNKRENFASMRPTPEGVGNWGHRYRACHMKTGLQ